MVFGENVILSRRFKLSVFWGLGGVIVGMAWVRLADSVPVLATLLEAFSVILKPLFDVLLATSSCDGFGCLGLALITLLVIAFGIGFSLSYFWVNKSK